MLHPRSLRITSAIELIQKYGWFEWLCHSNFSFLIGASHPSEYIARATNFMYSGLSFTDFDGVYGLARAHLYLKQIQKKLNARSPKKEVSLPKLFYGAELHLAKDHSLPILYQDTIALLAQNRQGYANLCRLVSYSHREGKNHAYIPISDLLNHPVDGVVAIQPMRGLIRRQSFDSQYQKSYEDRFSALSEHFQKRLYFAISKHFHPSEDAWIEPTITTAKRLNIPCILSQDAFFHEPTEKVTSDLLHAIRSNQDLNQSAHHFFVNSERSLHCLSNIAQRFGDLPIFESALHASRELSESFSFSLDEIRYQYPKEMIPEGLTAQTFLEKLTWESAKERYGSPLPQKIIQTLSHELSLIEALSFADYFLTVWDIVRWARSQRILCQGRGSAANSAVCFVLGITAVDPSLFDLLFERFISVERGDPPDIDVDFEHERREEVIQYIYNRYGRARAAMVANVITFRGRGALRAAGKALGIDDAILDDVSKALSTRFFYKKPFETILEHVREKHEPLSHSDNLEAPKALQGPWMAAESESKSTLEKEDPVFETLELNDVKLPDIWETWKTLAQRLHGFPRHLGIHSGGFIISHEALDSLVGQEPASMPGRSVIQWCKEDIEGLGFFKIDILALGMLTAIRKSFELIERYYSRPLDLSRIPQEDLATYSMIQRADTVGTFQIESRAQMSMLPRLKPRTFYDLVIEVAIIRPGPIQGGMIHPYLRRRAGLEPIKFPDDRLRPILARTLGIPIFQEQVMRIAMEIGDFTGGEANELRKHMGAFQLKGDINPWLKKLANGMRKNGIDEHFTISILKQMRGFAEYGFPESHAASFALIAYASCYLKCHYPAAFFASLLNSQPMGFYQPHVLLASAKNAGVSVLPICVQKSKWDSDLENIAPPDQPPVYAIRLGLRFVGGLRYSGAVNLEKIRCEAGGSFTNLDDFLRRSKLFRSDLAALAAAHALSCFGLERKDAIWLAEAAPFRPFLEEEEARIYWQSETELERAELDFAAFTTTLGPHPTQIIRKDHWCYPPTLNKIILAKDLKQIGFGKLVEVFGLVLVRQAPSSAKGMVFLTMEDETGFINLVFTPQIYDRYYTLVEYQAFLCVQGKLQKQGETHSILVEKVYKPFIQKADIIALTNEKNTHPKGDLLTLNDQKIWSLSRNYH